MQYLRCCPLFRGCSFIKAERPQIKRQSAIAMVPEWLNELAHTFDPFYYVMVMGTGISPNLLFSFPYEGKWLQRCSYPMFAVACLIFLYTHLLQLINMYVYLRTQSFKKYLDDSFRDLRQNVFWGAYPMGFATIINYIVGLAINKVKNPAVARRLMRLIYVFWWYDVFVSLLCAWGISFLIFQKHYYPDFTCDEKGLRRKMVNENLNSTLILLVVPLVVAVSSGGVFTMTDLFSATFNRNIQLMTMVVTALMWLHAVIFVFILIVIYLWNLYVNKIPTMAKVFTMFLLLGPMGQASFGVMLICDNVKLYTEKYYQVSELTTDYGILAISVPWCFKIFGLLSALALLSMGYFFTVLGLMALSSYYNTKICTVQGNETKIQRIYHYHKGWFSMTFPMGTMSLGSFHIYSFYGQYVPLSAFRVIGAIYAVVCVVWCLICLLGTLWVSVFPIVIGRYRKHRYQRSTKMTDHSEDARTSETFSDWTVQN
ncbi:hypothetical protein HG535_0H02690 [Zygotorulaspora mrakii]|uniref:Sulfite efflux pump SSU1 n=1 Tax=Zygotorulaspora mrakii TaxID=42260 RepID=A0A7H9BB16_ZYGMR|nr:uncharacterized protein HG535_0H02690 [Zygotorulaspora mrakii]QLG74942.1 hypothetical protein HG535_0H02690 [Zygotorulaspora mrakii]